MKNLIKSVLCVILLAACNQEPTTPTTTKQSDFFPLQVGNWWEYSVDTADAKGNFISAYKEQWEIVGDSVVNGKKYFIHQSKSENSVGTLQSYLTNESHGDVMWVENIVPRSFFDSITQKVLYFNKPIAEQWATYAEYSDLNISSIVSKTDSTQVPAGLFIHNCVILEQSMDDGYTSVYAAKVGLIKMYPAQFSWRKHKQYRLLKARVNGVTYPQISRSKNENVLF